MITTSSTVTTGPDCSHRAHVPVETIGRPLYGQESAPIIETVARLCINPACWAQLPVAWGCDECKWVRAAEECRLCDWAPRVTHVLVTPCTAHREGAPS